jgi:hypothetical protein
VKDHAALVPRHDDHVVIGPRAILDQREHRTSVAELAPRDLLSAGDACRPPAAPLQIRDQRIRADACRAAIDERRERLGVDAALAPVAQHHRGGGAAAQRL